MLGCNAGIVASIQGWEPPALLPSALPFLSPAAYLRGCFRLVYSIYFADFLGLFSFTVLDGTHGLVLAVSAGTLSLSSFPSPVLLTLNYISQDFNVSTLLFTNTHYQSY